MWNLQWTRNPGTLRTESLLWRTKGVRMTWCLGHLTSPLAVCFKLLQIPCITGVFQTSIQTVCWFVCSIQYTITLQKHMSNFPRWHLETKIWIITNFTWQEKLPETSTDWKLTGRQCRINDVHKSMRINLWIWTHHLIENPANAFHSHCSETHSKKPQGEDTSVDKFHWSAYKLNLVSYQSNATMKDWTVELYILGEVSLRFGVKS